MTPKQQAYQTLGNTMIKNFAKREIGKGGAFDSEEEIDEAIRNIDEQIRELKNKLSVVSKR